MSIPLRLSTASQVVQFGPFLASSDAFTVVSTGTMANTDIQVSKHGSTAQVNKNSGGGTHISRGVWYATFDATDTNTVGRMRVDIPTIAASTLAMPVWFYAVVMPTNVFDSLYGSTASLNVNVTSIALSSSAANNMSSAALSTLGGYCTSAASTVSTAILVLDVAAVTDGQIQGRQMVFKGDVTVGLRNQATQVSTWTAATSTASFVPLSVAPGNTDGFRIF